MARRASDSTKCGPLILLSTATEHTLSRLPASHAFGSVYGRPMTKKTRPQKPKSGPAPRTPPATARNDFGSIWAAAHHIGECARRGLGTESRLQLAPFLDATLDLAL